MNANAPTQPSASANGHYQRRARNYLLDPRFQLKYAGFLVAIAVLLSAVLGSQLWITSNAVITESQRTVQQGQETVRRGHQLLAESKKVSDVVAMNITRDPVYADNPELAKVFADENAQRERKLADEQRRLERDAADLQTQAGYLASQQRRTMFVLFGGLGLLVIAIGLTGIVFTHKVAGPIYKMKRLLRGVGDGKLHVGTGLRKGDELKHFFDAFVDMVEQLRKREEAQLALLDEALSQLQDTAPEKIKPLRELRDSMKARLES